MSRPIRAAAGRRSPAAVPAPIAPSAVAPSTKGLACPHCGSERVSKWGAAHGFPRYRCAGCGRTHNIRTNTSLARLRNKDQWLTFVGTMVEGRSIRKSAQACGVSAATVVRWRKRFTECTVEQKARILTLIVGTCPRGEALVRSANVVPDEFRTWFTDLVPVLLSWML